MGRNIELDTNASQLVLAPGTRLAETTLQLPTPVHAHATIRFLRDRLSFDQFPSLERNQTPPEQ